MTLSRRWTLRRSFRLCTPRVRCSTCLQSRRCPTGSVPPNSAHDHRKLPAALLLSTFSSARSTAILCNQPICPVCGAHTDVYSRITGYYRPIDNWNDGKLQEFRDRVMYKI
ncbi:MAG: anaerobic ribonucleoside-triphosphate reductase [Christensenellales bacterium]